jgi:hypothetical protein
MSRDERGRFTDCGNYKGRPKKEKPEPSTVEQREDFFDVDNASIVIVENGKRKKISVRKAIYQKLAFSAASGDTRAAVEWNKMRDRFVVAYLDEQIGLFTQIVESEKTLRAAPEDVSDKFLLALHTAKTLLGPSLRNQL